jgi:hypothetical protein
MSEVEEVLAAVSRLHAALIFVATAGVDSFAAAPA